MNLSERKVVSNQFKINLIPLYVSILFKDYSLVSIHINFYHSLHLTFHSIPSLILLIFISHFITSTTPSIFLPTHFEARRATSALIFKKKITCNLRARLISPFHVSRTLTNSQACHLSWNLTYKQFYPSSHLSTTPIHIHTHSSLFHDCFPSPSFQVFFLRMEGWKRNCLQFVTTCRASSYGRLMIPEGKVDIFIWSRGSFRPRK